MYVIIHNNEVSFLTFQLSVLRFFPCTKNFVFNTSEVNEGLSNLYTVFILLNDWINFKPRILFFILLKFDCLEQSLHHYASNAALLWGRSAAGRGRDVLDDGVVNPEYVEDENAVVVPRRSNNPSSRGYYPPENRYAIDFDARRSAGGPAILELQSDEEVRPQGRRRWVVTSTAAAASRTVTPPPSFDPPTPPGTDRRSDRETAAVMFSRRNVSVIASTP